MQQKRPHFCFFQNSQCEYFPCHETEHPEDFNCLFCYCPLYALGRKCGGNFVYRDGGVKDCSNCMVPHRPENYGRITMRYMDILEMVKKNDAEHQE